MGKNLYFPNLNGLRFIAATLVMIHHTEQRKSMFHLGNYWHNTSILMIGKLGVVMFFVLSGYLITYLLLNEEDNKGNISIKNFYVRRILRIWPLYFLIFILAFLVLPHFELFHYYVYDISYDNFPWITFFLFLFMLPNMALSQGLYVPYDNQSWSIGTEEQFYLSWPFLMIVFRKYRKYLMYSIIFIYVIIKVVCALTDPFIFGIDIYAFWQVFNIDCMAIGGLFAIWSFQQEGILKYLKNTKLFYLTVVATILLISLGVRFSILEYEVYGVLFAIIILNLSTNEDLKKTLENRVFNYLGTISYGIYMYHPIALVVSIKLFMAMGWNIWFVFPLIFLITVILAHLSYKYFEMFFLRLKNKF